MTTRPGPTRVSEDHDFEPFRAGPMAGTGVCCVCGEQEAQHGPPDPRDALLREAHTVLGYFPTHPDTQPLRERIEAAIGDKEESNRE